VVNITYSPTITTVSLANFQRLSVPNTSPSVKPSLVHGQANGISSNAISIDPARADQISSAAWKWIDGISGNVGSEIINYTINGGKLTGLITLTPAANYTFDGFATTGANRAAIDTLLTIDGKVPTLTFELGTPNAAGQKNLLITAVYPVAKLAVVVSSLGVNSYPTAPVAFAMPAGTLAFSAPATLESSLGGSWSDSGREYAANETTRTYTFTAKVASTDQPYTEIGTATAWKAKLEALLATHGKPEVKVTRVSDTSVEVVLTYPIAKKKILGTDLNPLYRVLFSKVPTKNDFITETGDIKVADSSIDIPLEIINARWVTGFSGTPPKFVNTAGAQGTYEFTIKPKPGYTLFGTSPADFATLMSSIAGIGGYASTSAVINADDEMIVSMVFNLQ
jgi:hypothetical protein